MNKTKIRVLLREEFYTKRIRYEPNAFSIIIAIEEYIKIMNMLLNKYVKQYKITIKYY